MYFPVAAIEAQPWIPPLTAFIISFFTSMGGVSGAFLLLPFQISFLHFDAPAVSATNHVYNVVAIPSGVYQYIKEGRMVWPLTWAVTIGTLPGVFAGTFIRIHFLPDPVSFKRFAALVLLYIGGRLLRDIFTRATVPEKTVVKQQPVGVITAQSFSLKSISYRFNRHRYEVSTCKIITLSLIVGVVGGIYGIGGGAIIAPFFVTYFGLPIYTVAAAALTGTLLTSAAGICFFHLIAPFYQGVAIIPDWKLGLLFGAGGFLGMYCGAKMQRFVPERVIKAILSLCILFTAFSYLGILGR